MHRHTVERFIQRADKHGFPKALDRSRSLAVALKPRKKILFCLGRQPRHQCEQSARDGVLIAEGQELGAYERWRAVKWRRKKRWSKLRDSATWLDKVQLPEPADLVFDTKPAVEIDEIGAAAE